MKTLAIGRNNRRLAVWFPSEAGREIFSSSNTHRIRVSGIKGGNTDGCVLVFWWELAVVSAGAGGAEAGAGAGAGAEGQPGMRSPRFVSSYEWSNEYPVEEECARVT